MKQIHEFTFQETLRGYNLSFKTTYDLFSCRAIDTGTKLLIDNIQVENGQTCLDLGCGYGPIGMTLAKLNPTGEIYMVDRDIVAIEYSKINCQLNNLSNCVILPSNGFNDLGDKTFDLIASNLPTHIAKEALEIIINDAKAHLNKNGKFYIVCTTKLKPYIQRLLEPVFPLTDKIDQSNGYSLLLANS